MTVKVAGQQHQHRHRTLGVANHLCLARNGVGKKNPYYSLACREPAVHHSHRGEDTGSGQEGEPALPQWLMACAWDFIKMGKYFADTGPALCTPQTEELPARAGLPISARHIPQKGKLYPIISLPGNPMDRDFMGWTHGSC